MATYYYLSLLPSSSLSSKKVKIIKQIRMEISQKKKKKSGNKSKDFKFPPKKGVIQLWSFILNPSGHPSRNKVFKGIIRSYYQLHAGKNKLTKDFLPFWELLCFVDIDRL